MTIKNKLQILVTKFGNKLNYSQPPNTKVWSPAMNEIRLHK